MLYLEKLLLPSESIENQIIDNERRTCFGSVYPFKIFPQKELLSYSFSPITVFYGGNGSGKTTLLNIIAEKIGAIRHCEFNKSPFFEKYLKLCKIKSDELPRLNQILSSDDVFDYVLNIRYLNQDIDNHREELFRGYATVKHKAMNDSEYRKFHGLEDYDRFKEVHSAMFKNESTFVKERLARNIDMYSNGETAFRYFTEHITENAIYLLDEPENSLSVKLQTDLAKYISDSARFYNCQFVISTHSPIFLSMTSAEIYDLDSVPVKTKNWTELENVRAYYNFFKNHENEFI